ncbi:MAG TPA: AmmeMemoRadiSam system protein B [bacterium]|nr:AmmeMemoRadiSam system protein B [bacterium]
MLRFPVAAGTFYEKDAPRLKKQVAALLKETGEKIKAKAVIAPHAGYVYSGAVAGEVFSSVVIPDIIIFIGPNHTGRGRPVAVMADGEWRTPLGDVRINGPVADEIIKNSRYAENDMLAHDAEHSIEVMLPIIQELKRSFTIVPVALGTHDLGSLKDTAESIAGAVKNRDVLIAASTDFTHYESAESARKKDALVIEAIEKMDPEAMAAVVGRHDISMCGMAAVYTALHAALILGAKDARILRYTNSGETSGDFSSVVGYAGGIIT